MGLRFKTFGVPELFAEGQVVMRLRYRKAYALLGYLVVERNRWHERRHLAALLWPQLPSDAARANLRLVLKNLADVLAAAGAQACVKTERERLGLFPGDTFDTDVLLLDEQNRKRLRQCGDGAECVRLLAHWQPWLALLEGEFLAGIETDAGGEFEDWLGIERAKGERAKNALLRECVAAARRCDALDDALRVARLWTRCCPTDDEAARAQMELLAARGDARGALEAYADFAARLASMVGVLPAPATEALRQHVATAVEDAVSHRPETSAPLRDEVRRVVVLHVEPELGNEDELLEPERYLGPLGPAFDAALARWGGRQYPASGVALAAVFGLAEDGEQAPRRALRAALEIAALPTFRRARIGLCEGKALIAATARQPIAGSVLPALAQRLAMCGEPGEVIVTALLVREPGAGVGFTPLPPRRFAGMAGEHVPCRVDAVPGTDETSCAAIAATPFVGRWAELVRLTETIAMAGDQGGALFIELVGQAGTGKSRLLAEFARTHAHAGGTVRWIAHRPEMRHVALGGLREHLRGENVNMGKLAGRGLLDAALARLFAPSDNGRPVLLVFDDMHWTDETTRELLAIAMQAPPAAPVLTILACRPGTTPITAGIQPMARIALPPLSTPESVALIAALDPDEHIGEAQRTQLAKMSGGLPLCAEYIARTARDQSVPDASLFGVLQSVLDRMGTNKGVLQAASVLGATFQVGFLRALLPGHDIAAALQSATALAIVERKAEEVFAFRHALLRDCAYESAPPQTRRDWHRVAAAWLSRQLDAAPADIAQHHEMALDWDGARRAWRQAAEMAYLDEFAKDAKTAALCALAAAAKHGHCTAVEQAELELLAGYAALMTDGYGAKGAQKYFAPLVAPDAPRLPDDLMFRALSGMVAAFPQGHREGLAMIRRLEGMARLPVHRMMVAYGFGSFLFWRGEFAASLQHLEEAIRIGATIPAREWLRYSADNPVIACLALKAVNLGFSGPGAAAVAAADQAVAAARRKGRVHGLCFALTLAAGVYRLLDRPAEVAQLAGEGLELATQRHFQFWQAYNALFDLWAKARQGRLVLRKSFSLFSLHREIAAASRLSPVTSWWFVACVCEALESWALLDMVAARALSLALETGDTYCMPDLMRQRALARHARGDAGGARHWLERADKMIRDQGNFGLAPRVAELDALVSAMEAA